MVDDAGSVWPGLAAAGGTEHVEWATTQMQDRSGVALVVPAGFEAHARLLHRRTDGRRWADVDPRPLAGGEADDPAWDLTIEGQDTGRLDPPLVDALLPLLVAATGSPDRCHYALWEGWGDLHAGSSGLLTAPSTGLRRFGQQRRLRRLSRDRDRELAELWRFVERCPRYEWWGGRTMRLFDGPAEAVASIRTWHAFEEENRRSPQWWWPQDRAWFVATEIDHPWTYVAGSSSLVDAVLSDDRWESVTVSADDPW